MHTMKYPLTRKLVAIKFREWIGGEAKIYAYCHDLAVKGGRMLADKFGTRLMDEDGEFTAQMVSNDLPTCCRDNPPSLGERGTTSSIGRHT